MTEVNNREADISSDSYPKCEKEFRGAIPLYLLDCFLINLGINLPVLFL